MRNRAVGGGTPEAASSAAYRACTIADKHTRMPPNILLRIPTESSATSPLAAKPVCTPTPMVIPIGVMSCGVGDER